MNNNIFKKINPNDTTSSDLNVTNTISKIDIMNSIPDNATHYENNVLNKIKKEWRWIIYKFPNNKNQLIEISQKEPNCKRLCINKNSEWVEEDNESKYKQYEVERYYVYE
jgi:hypothetical protein